MKENQDYEFRVKSAQGDMSNLSMTIDAAINDKPDLIITLNSQTLYTLLKKNHSIPTVFCITADPYLLGAGKSDTDHLPNVTGTYYLFPYKALMKAIKDNCPKVKTIGTIFNIGDIESTTQKDLLVKAAQETGLKIETAGFSFQNEISSTVINLYNKNIDGIVQIYDSYMNISYPIIVQKSKDYKKPVFSCNPENAGRTGSLISISNRPKDFGTTFINELVIPILNRKSLKDIPFLPHSCPQNIFYVDLDAMKKINYNLPESFLTQCIPIN